MTQSREGGPSDERNLQMIASEVAPFGRDIPATERRVALVFQRYNNRVPLISKDERPNMFAMLLTPGYAGVQEFAFLVQRHGHIIEGFKEGTDDSIVRSIFRGTLESARSEADTRLERLHGPLDDEGQARRDHWVKRKTKMQDLLDELGPPPND